MDRKVVRNWGRQGICITQIFLYIPSTNKMLEDEDFHFTTNTTNSNITLIGYFERVQQTVIICIILLISHLST